LSALAHAGADYILKGTIVGATIEGGVTGVAAATAGVLTGNPLLTVAGTSAVVGLAHLTLPAYEVAGSVATEIGEGTTKACHNAFEFARQLSNGGRR